MAEVRLRQYLATVRIKLAEEVVLQHSPSSPVIIGHELAQQIHEYVVQHEMGYYPALDYFANELTGQDGLDPDLIDATESMSWLVCRLVRNEFQSRLRQVFSSVKFQTVQTIAYTMPAVRFGAANALHDLAVHFTPLSVKLELVLSRISKGEGDEGAEEFIHNAIQQWLKDSFEFVEVSSVVAIAQ